MAFGYFLKSPAFSYRGPKVRLLYHLAFWICTILLLAYHGSLLGSSFQENLINMLSLLPMQMIAAYSLIYFLLSRYLYQGKYLLFLLGLLISAYALSVLARLSIIHIAEPLIGFDGYDESIWEVISDPIYLIKVYMVSVYLPAALLLILKMMKERFQQENKLVKLEREKSVAELNFLKAQMNPHFLFNTLNNIYALAKNGSEQTADMILKLSEILDYTLYECSQPKVPISREWELIENYADLQSLRHADKLIVMLEQDLDDPAVEVSPLLLIALVENAFKYALGNGEKAPSIKINLRLRNRRLSFRVFNTKNEEYTEHKPRGIGIKNLQGQLNLQYPNRHEMDIEVGKDSYQVLLQIDL